MNDYLRNFIEHSGQVDSLLAAAVLWIGLAAIGSLFIGKDQPREAAPFLGWAVVSFVFTTFGVLTNIPFSYLALAMILPVLFGIGLAWRRKIGFLPGDILKMAVLAAPLILLVSAMIGSQWDEFTDWLMTPRLLLRTDAFPNRDNVHLSGALAAYPFGWHYIAYLASKIGGRFLENAGALINLFMLLTFGLISARLILAGSGRAYENISRGWGLYALGGLFATVLSTTFAQKVALTSYADVSTAAILGIAGLLGWRMLEAISDEQESIARRYAIQIGLLMMLLVNLKQSTVALFAIFVFALFLTGLRDPRIKITNLLRQLPWIIIPGIIIFLLWRHYVSMELSSSEMSVRPISQWYISYIPDILLRMLTVLSKKGAFLILFVVVVFFGVRAALRYRTPFDRLALLVALVFLGHNAFLLFAYVTTFGKFDALRVASYWRYNMQLGMLGVVFMSYGVGYAWKQYGEHRFDIRKLSWLPVLLMVVMPFVFANKLRFDRFQPTSHYRTVGADLGELLTMGDTLLVLDPKGSGESAAISRYELGGSDIYKMYVSLYQKPSFKSISQLISKYAFSHILIHSVTPDVTGVLRMELANDQSYLVRGSDKDGWQVVRAWPFPN